LQAKALDALSNSPQTADQIAADIGAASSAESVYLTLEHLAANGRAKMKREVDPGETKFSRA
ncbi:MAG: glucose-6-phosphate isomerase, partial [Candidatus Acidiferrales bacterium]